MRLVQKFGGTSVADIARLEKAALTVKKFVDDGCQVVVVVSAMAGVTNKLVGYAKALSPVCDHGEYDAVVSSGEQVSAGLFAMALMQIGVQAQSFQGWQVPIITCDEHSDARIKRIDPDNLERCLSQGIVPVVCGFQGVTQSGRVATLGRGGSDTTAVALAGALGAHRCDIYTDVEGVYTADPRVVPTARKLSEITYDEMAEFAAEGAKVLHARSVETAQKHGVKVQVLSSFSRAPGTIVMPGRHLNRPQISGVTHSINWCSVRFKTPVKTQEIPFTAEKQLFNALTHNNIETTMMLRSELTDDNASVLFAVPNKSIAKTIQIVESLKSPLVLSDLHVDSGVAKVTIVGLNMQNSYCQLGQRMATILKKKGLHTKLIDCSYLKVSLLTEGDCVEQVVQVVHAELGLEKEKTE